MFESIINPIFGPLLGLPAFWAVFILAFVIALLITFVYKWMTDQHLMKSLKEEIKGFQKQMKEFKSDPKKVMAIQKRAMETNMKYMMHSMKPTLITFIPIIIIFGWMHANLAFEPIMPGEEFMTTLVLNEGVSGDVNLIVSPEIEFLSDAKQEIKEGKAAWKLKGEGGDYILEYQVDDRAYTKELLITDEQAYRKPVKAIKDDKVREIKINNEKTVPLSIFGWKIGWLGTYIIFSLIFSITLRKILKLH
ncbi:DUF106 domain-containing protein [Candidatus Woesearchaeota archaeon]|nr:DUF106 domain-containing protein [Candidatus Woesearchaeota archaeon]